MQSDTASSPFQRRNISWFNNVEMRNWIGEHHTFRKLTWSTFWLRSEFCCSAQVAREWSHSLKRCKTCLWCSTGLQFILLFYNNFKLFLVTETVCSNSGQSRFPYQPVWFIWPPPSPWTEIYNAQRMGQALHWLESISYFCKKLKRFRTRWCSL